MLRCRITGGHALARLGGVTLQRPEGQVGAGCRRGCTCSSCRVRSPGGTPTLWVSHAKGGGLCGQLPPKDEVPGLVSPAQPGGPAGARRARQQILPGELTCPLSPAGDLAQATRAATPMFPTHRICAIKCLLFKLLRFAVICDAKVGAWDSGPPLSSPFFLQTGAASSSQDLRSSALPAAALGSGLRHPCEECWLLLLETGFQKPSSACGAARAPRPRCWALTGTAQRQTHAHPTNVQSYCSLCTWELVLTPHSHRTPTGSPGPRGLSVQPAAPRPAPSVAVLSPWVPARSA